VHPLSFLQKRAHLCAVARGREMFAHIEDMTPARFDLLYLIFQGESELVKLTAALGLARQTVWKMMDRLVQLGLIIKMNSHYPRRRILLFFTQEGARRTRLAMGAAFSERLPLPKDAPAGDDVPRYWRRPELAEPPILRSTSRNREHAARGRCKSGLRHDSARGARGVEDPKHATRRDELGLVYETSRGPRPRTSSVWCASGAWHEPIGVRYESCSRLIRGDRCTRSRDASSLRYPMRMVHRESNSQRTSSTQPKPIALRCQIRSLQESCNAGRKIDSQLETHGARYESHRPDGEQSPGANVRRESLVEDAWREGPVEDCQREGFVEATQHEGRVEATQRERLAVCASGREGRRHVRCTTNAPHEPRDGGANTQRARVYESRGEMSAQGFAYATHCRTSAASRTLGREVARTYSRFAWRRTRGGRRGKRDRYLLYLDDLISLTQDIAAALGNRARPIYQLRITTELDH
jgi:DNA-binding MarR family transcriptional regulator